MFGGQFRFYIKSFDIDEIIKQSKANIKTPFDLNVLFYTSMF